MPLTIATWNVQNFALPIGGTSAALGQKLRLIAETLARLNPDVIALQEALDGNAAQRIATSLNGLVGGSAYNAVNGQPDSRDNRVAFISRLPIDTGQTESLSAWRVPPGETIMRQDRVGGRNVTVPEPTLPRPPLRVRVSLTDGTTLDVINVHLKSKQLRFPGGGFSTHDEALRTAAAELALKRRTAEAMTVRARVNQLLAVGQRVVVLGDFNDGPDAATTRLLCEGLVNLTQLIPADARWSRNRDGRPEMLDQILASEGLMPRHENQRDLPAVKVLNDAAPNAASDHALVYATFPALG